MNDFKEIMFPRS